MADNINETVRAAFDDTYQRGFADGYAAGIAAVLEKIHSLSVEPGVQAPSMNVNIDILELSTRASNILRRNGVRTVGDIYKQSTRRSYDGSTEITYLSLRDFKDLGSATFSEIRKKLMKLGYPDIDDGHY